MNHSQLRTRLPDQPQAQNHNKRNQSINCFGASCNRAVHPFDPGPSAVWLTLDRAGFEPYSGGLSHQSVVSGYALLLSDPNGMCE